MGDSQNREGMEWMGFRGLPIALAFGLVFCSSTGFAQDEPKDTNKDADQKEAQPKDTQSKDTQPKDTQSKNGHVLPTLRVRMPAQQPKRPRPKPEEPVVTAAPAQRPAIETVAVSPTAGSEIDRDKVPSNVVIVGSEAFDYSKAPNLTQAMQRALPYVSLGDQTGNPFQPDINYRGFVASPVIGTPQGLAVYQNGVRINEAFGDTVNWDLIPQKAINRMTLQPNNPVFGLNAIGGAISIDMKNGFTYQGNELELFGGSFGRISGSAQTGVQNGNYSAYATADAVNDSGWRDFGQSAAQLRRMYVDVGARGDQAEFHVAFTGADNHLSGTVATPVQMLEQRWSSIYTWPQTVHNQLAFLTVSGSWKPSDTFSLQASAYFRGFRQSHFDGNTTSASNDPANCPDPAFVCFPDNSGVFNNLVTTTGAFVPATGSLAFPAVLGQIDRTSTSTNTFGGTVQGTTTAQLFGHDNHFVAGVSVDNGRTRFAGNSELGTIDQNLFVTGTGVFINELPPFGDVAPVNLLARNIYTGIYATDTFDVTSRLSVTAGGRFNIAQINLADQTGTNPGLNSNNRFERFNPVVGTTYKITSNMTAYAGYSEANRAPTPLELGCADPMRPCLIDSFLVSDPPLKQVVSHTYEAGLRGKLNLGAPNGQLAWHVGVYRTTNDDDIINVASPQTGFGYFVNAGKTRRQGVEADVAYKWDRWNAYANYTFVDATYQSSLTLSSPNNPAANADGNIFVMPGDHIPAIPAHRFKAGAEYQITDAWKLGADLNVVGSQYLIHDDTNANPKVPAYWVVNLHGSYQITKNVEVFALAQNVFNQHYFAAGTFFDRGQIPFLNLTDPRTFVPGMPLAAYAGIRATF
jgi:iron complex outermembrane recepter protein